MATTRGTVFISYAHENDDHVKRVWELAEWLDKRRWTVIYDRPFIDTPPGEGWSAWMRSGIKTADCVLIVCSPKLKERYEKESPPDEGRGARYEGAIVTRLLYKSLDRNTKFYPIAPDGGSPNDVPIDLEDWDNNHRFPSKNERIEKLLDGAKRAAASRPASCGDADPASPVAPNSASPETRESIVSTTQAPHVKPSTRSHHATLTLELLAEPQARALLNALAGRLDLRRSAVTGGDATETAGAVVDLLAAPPDGNPSLRHLDVVTQALSAIEVSAASQVQRKAIEKAAIALYFLRAVKLVERAGAQACAAGTGGQSLRVPIDAPMLCAVVAAELAGGKILVDRSSGSGELRPKNIHVIRPSANGRFTFNALMREIYSVEFPPGVASGGPPTTEVTLEAGPLSRKQWGELATRVRRHRETHNECFAIVVPANTDGGDAAKLATDLNATVFFGVDFDDQTARALFLVDPEALFYDFNEFCRELNSFAGGDAMPPVSSPAAHAPTSPSSTLVVNVPGSHNTIQIPSGAHSIAQGGSANQAGHGSRRGLDSDELAGLVKELRKAISGLGSSKARQSLEPKAQTLEAQLRQPKGADAKGIKATADSIAHVADALEDGEKIVGICGRIIAFLVPFIV